MSERDPRVDPIPGDVLCGEYSREFAVIRREDNGCIVNQKPPWGPRRVFVPASMWRKWAANATVVRQAQEPK